MAFDYSTMKTGDLVDVSTEWDFSNPVAGCVTRTESDCCFIDVLGSGNPPLEFCRHLDDERITSGPELFNEEQKTLTDNYRVEPRTGVFRKSRSQALLEEIPDRLAAVERLLSEVVVDLASLKAPPPVEEESKPVRRPRGRPRSKPAVEPAAEPVGAS